MRKPWMRGLKAYKFTADGTMLMETFYEQRRANSRDAGKCTGGQYKRTQEDNYAIAMGLSLPDARKVIHKHKKMLGQ